MEQTDIAMLLGQLKGGQEVILANQAAQSKQLESMDARLREQERKSAALGALSGGIVSVGVALVVEGLKSWSGGQR